jgi:hypothetical protein
MNLLVSSQTKDHQTADGQSDQSAVVVTREGVEQAPHNVE